MPNDILDGLVVTLPPVLVPSPDSATVCGLPLPLSAKSSVAVLVPVVVGAKRTLTVQVAEAAKLVPHVFEKISNSPGSAPEKAILLMLMAAELVLDRVTTF